MDFFTLPFPTSAQFRATIWPPAKTPFWRFCRRADSCPLYVLIGIVHRLERLPFQIACIVQVIPTNAIDNSTVFGVDEASVTEQVAWLGENCTGRNDLWCKSTVSGGVVCDADTNTCECATGQFRKDNVTCFQGKYKGPPGGSLFPCSSEINWLVPLFPKKSKICFLMFPVPQYCLCSPVPLKIWPLFPCSPEINTHFRLFLSNPWECLSTGRIRYSCPPVCQLY